MSFIIDPPLLFLSGILIFFVGKKLDWNRHAKIVVGMVIALIFILFSSLLYADIIRCVFPFFAGMKGSEFMLHTNLTGISKADVPVIVVVVLFLLYPFWIFFGYASVLLVSKRRHVSKKVCSFSDVKSRHMIENSVYRVARDPDVKKCVRSAIDSVGGIKEFVKNGDKVIIKVNICGGVPEIRGTFTSTEVVGELVALIRSVGAEPLIVDSDMIWTKFWQAASDSGWADWARNKGVRLLNLADTELVWFDFGNESAVCVEMISKELIDAEVIISVPVMKTHLLTGVTLGMKNMYGTFPDIDKAKFHREMIENVIYEINLAFTPNLTIIDGSIGGEAIGPLSCTPLNFQTIVASNDVVTADAIACQLMGYDPMDITHLKIAHEHRLGDASKKYNLDDLPYRHANGKDGNWKRPDPKVKDFYEWCIELLLKLPGWQTLFNIGADFFLYDLARLPGFCYLTPAFLQIMNDVVYLNISGFKDTDQDKARRRINISIMVLVALASVAGFYADGYIWRSNLLFDLSFLLAFALGMIAAARMKTFHLVALLSSSALVSAVAEHINTSSGLLRYTGSPDVSLFVVSGWMLMMVVIIYLSDFLTKWLSLLGIFKKLQRWNNLPVFLALAIFAAFMVWEGYLAIANREVLALYAFMAALGLLYSTKHSIEWNASLMVVSIAIGGYMELLGSLAGFWQYHFMEPLAMVFVLSWALNTWTIHCIIYLIGIDLGAYKDRYLLRSVSH
ncbi:Uncharacterised protein [uncultured archaeon]|nr:Uncharacterised protein [uncultured archaeon]